MNKKKIVAIVLSAGRGTRMNSALPKQYLKIDNKEVLYYTLKAFEDSKVDEIIIVSGKEDIDYCYKEIVKKNNLSKVTKIVEGGRQRYDSVCKGLQAAKNTTNYVLIHDGARPCIDIDTINGVIECVKEHKACIVAVGAKDTIKIVKNGIVVDSPDRKTMWQAQTPQAFSYTEIKDAYKNVIELGEEALGTITDDASVWSKYREEPVFVYEGKYTNLKITTIDDMKMVENYLKNPLK